MANPTTMMREDFQHYHRHHGNEVSPPAPPPPQQQPKEGNGAVPSGFILKLYQMVNGAPDDVICWTQGGDAFKIGADLNKLEAETLPQYFRHSRFQSLVRQLNFYNFRKVNRERTFWIYKHRLFHRDRPQDLHLLRRRTCPGVDGRKNRFSSTGSAGSRKSNNSSANSSSDNLVAMAGGATSSEHKKSTTVLDCLETNDVFRSHTNSREHSDTDDSTVADPSDDESSAIAAAAAARKPRRKRSNTASYEKPPRFPENNKRSRRGWNLNYNAAMSNSLKREESEPEDDVHVDLSLVTSAASVSNAPKTGGADPLTSTRLFGVAKDEDDDDVSASGDKDEREQSLVVSQVAMKLEEYVRKAKKGSGRARRNGPQGVVTPPHPNAHAMAYSAPRGVLTYDDEYNYDSDDDDESMQRRARSSSSSTGVVTDGDDSMTSEDEPRPVGGKKVAFVSEVNTPVQPVPKKLFLLAPVDDVKTVNVVVKTLLERANTDVPATIAQFCMTTAPNGCDDLCSKILQLISSCDMLGIEFQQYRGALHPLECSSTLLPSCMFTTGFRKNHAVSVQQIWERSASRNDAVRDFKTFAVNCLNEVLDNAEVDKNFLSTSETSALKHTADIWLKSSTASF